MTFLLIFLLIIVYYLIFILKYDVFYYVLPEKFFVFLHSFGGKNQLVGLDKEFSIENREESFSDTIPKVFIQTMKKLTTTKRHYEKINSFKKYYPEFDHFIYDDKMMESLMMKSSEKIRKSFSKLTQGAMKADLFRLVYLYEFGGYYFDSDSYISSKLPVKPEDDMIVFRVDSHVIQWAIICAKKHPIIKKAIEISCYNILNDRPIVDKRYPEPLAAGYAGPVVLGHAIEKIIGFNITKDINMKIPKSEGRSIKLLNFRNIKGINHKYAGYEADMILMKQKRWKSNTM